MQVQHRAIRFNRHYRTVFCGQAETMFGITGEYLKENIQEVTK